MTASPFRPVAFPALPRRTATPPAPRVESRAGLRFDDPCAAPAPCQCGDCREATLAQQASRVGMAVIEIAMGGAIGAGALWAFMTPEGML